MELITISELSKVMDTSTRTLRYYEELGLIESSRKPDYAYRVYDEKNVSRIQQILILRKLNIDLKTIKVILGKNDIVSAINVFQQKISDIDEETSSLNTVKNVLEMLIDYLRSNKTLSLSIDMLEDDDVKKILDSSTLLKNNLKEKKSMSELKEASEKLNKIENVRIVHIPPFTVAAAFAGVGKEPERRSGEMMSEFIHSNKLYDVTKDLRVFGFNNPSPVGNEDYGYEFWVTIPENFEVKPPMVKKQLEGGLYAAHCIKMGDFHEWQMFVEWLTNSEEYDYVQREPMGMHGSLEEHLNAYNFYKDGEKDFIQLDLLIPIKKK